MTSPVDLPPALRDLTAGSRWTVVTDGESGASVHRVEAPDDSVRFLKHASGALADALAAEHARLEWLAPRVSVPTVRGFERTANDAWLLTDALPGQSARAALTDALAVDPSRVAMIAQALGRAMRALHEIPAADCPFDSAHVRRLADAQRRIARGDVDVTDFDEARQGWSAEQVWDALVSLDALPFERVVTHGDYSLDNVFVQGTSVTGVLDVGRAGVADPYQDLAICRRDLGEHGTEAQVALLRGYGLSTLDEARVEFHLLLDELF